MIRDGFDYTPVWANSLWQRHVTVHRRPALQQATERTRFRDDGRRRVDLLVSCGGAAYYRFDTDENGQELGGRLLGVVLCLSHALTMKAGFCLNCWPEGAPGMSLYTLRPSRAVWSTRCRHVDAPFRGTR